MLKRESNRLGPVTPTCTHPPTSSQPTCIAIQRREQDGGEGVLYMDMYLRFGRTAEALSKEGHVADLVLLPLAVRSLAAGQSVQPGALLLLLGGRGLLGGCGLGGLGRCGL